MLDYHYQIAAPADVRADELKQFLEDLGEYALEIGFEKTVAISCVFKSVDQLDFARRIFRLPSVEDERLKRADFSSDPSVFRQDRGQGVCRVYPVEGQILVVENKDGLETAFGFLRFPEEVVGIAEGEDRVTIEHPAGDSWSFSGSIQSGASEYRQLVKKFEESGFLESVSDEYERQIDSNSEAEYVDYTPLHPELIPDSEIQALSRLNELVSLDRLEDAAKTTFLEGWWSLCWLHPELHPDDQSEWKGETAAYRPLADEAFRRLDLGEIRDDEVYATEAAHNRIWTESRNSTKFEDDESGDSLTQVPLMEESDDIDPEGRKVIILKGRFAGQEGICLGPVSEGKWAVSPDNSNDVVNLIFEEEFGILLNPNQEPGSS